MITRNPYNGIDVASCVKLLSNTHEHIYAQEMLESCWNRGIRNINLMNYSPSSPQQLVDKNVSQYSDFLDWESTTNLVKFQRQFEKKVSEVYRDSFIDVHGNEVITADIVGVPNAEHVNIDGYSYMVHSNYLGSTYADAGWISPIGDKGGLSTVEWRKAHKLITAQELFDGVRNNIPFGKVFGTINHPKDPTFTDVDIKNFIDASNGLIQAVEVFNQYYTTAVNNQFNELYDWLLSSGYQLWCTSVVDWQGTRGEHIYDYDRGGNLLLLPTDYNSMTYQQKQNAILDSYINGQYFPVGLGSLQITSFVVNNVYIKFTLNKSCDIYAISNSKQTYLGNKNSIVYSLANAKKYVRFYCDDNNGDFLYTNPIFINNDGNISKKALVLNMI